VSCYNVSTLTPWVHPSSQLASNGFLPAASSVLNNSTDNCHILLTGILLPGAPQLWGSLKVVGHQKNFVSNMYKHAV